MFLPLFSARSWGGIQGGQRFYTGCDDDDGTIPESLGLRLSGTRCEHVFGRRTGNSAMLSYTRSGIRGYSLQFWVPLWNCSFFQSDISSTDEHMVMVDLDGKAAWVIPHRFWELNFWMAVQEYRHARNLGRHEKRKLFRYLKNPGPRTQTCFRAAHAARTIYVNSFLDMKEAIATT